MNLALTITAAVVLALFVVGVGIARVLINGARLEELDHADNSKPSSSQPRPRGSVIDHDVEFARRNGIALDPLSLDWEVDSHER